MKRLKMILAAAAVGMLGAASAHANVVYDWHPLTPGENAAATSGRIEITDAAYRAGSINVAYGIRPGAYPLGDTDPDTSLPSAIPFAGLAFADIQFGGMFYAFVQPGTESFFAAGDQLQAILSFTPTGYLTGQMYVAVDDTNFYASGAGDLWEIDSVNSDIFGEVCHEDLDPCSAGTGYWAADPGTLPSDVPGPQVWSLFMLAVLGGFGLKRARKDYGAESI